MIDAPATRPAGGEDWATTSSTRAGSIGRVETLFIVFGAAAWSAVVGAVAVWRHQQFLSHRFDLGNMVQALWSTTQGRPLEMTDGATGEQIVRLAAHIDPILLVFTPLWWIYPQPEGLILAYVAIIAAGAYPVFRLALNHTGSRLVAGLLGAWYLTCPWTIWLAFNELNPTVLALPLLLFAICALDDGRLGHFAIFAALAVMTGELIGLTVAGIGVWYALSRSARAGLVIAGAGLAWTTLCVGVFLPAFSDGQPNRYYDRFESVGGSPIGLLETALLDPGAILHQLATVGDVRYLFLLILPTAFAFTLQPLLLVATVPQLGVNLISEFPATVSPLYHYSAPVLAVLFAATAMAVGRLPRRFRVAGGGLVLGFGLALLAIAFPAPGREVYLFPPLETTSRVRAMQDAIDLVPSEATVTATNRLGGHLSARRIVHLLPARSGAAWAVIDTRDRSSDARWLGRRSLRRVIAGFDRDRSWQLVFGREGVLVYRKRS